MRNKRQNKRDLYKKKLFKKKPQTLKKKFGLVILFNCISTPYGLFNAKIYFICLVYLLNAMSTPHGLFNSKICFICLA